MRRTISFQRGLHGGDAVVQAAEDLGVGPDVEFGEVKKASRFAVTDVEENSDEPG